MMTKESEMRKKGIDVKSVQEGVKKDAKKGKQRQ